MVAMRRKWICLVLMVCFGFMLSACQKTANTSEGYAYALLSQDKGRSELVFFDKDHQKLKSAALDWEVTSPQYAVVKDKWLFYSYPAKGDKPRLLTVKQDTGEVDKNLEVHQVISFGADASAIFTIEVDANSAQYSLVKYDHDLKELGRQVLPAVVSGLLVTDESVFVMGQNLGAYVMAYDKENVIETNRWPLPVMGNLVDGKMVHIGQNLYGLVAAYDSIGNFSGHSLFALNTATGQTQSLAIQAEQVGNLLAFEDKLYFSQDSELVEVSATEISNLKPVADFGQTISGLTASDKGLYLLGSSGKKALVLWANGQLQALPIASEKSHTYSLQLMRP